MNKVTSFSILPEGYLPVLDIDLKRKGTLMIINIGSLLMIIGFAVGYIIYKQMNPSNASGSFEIVNLLIYLFIALILITVHELIHGIFFKLGTNQKVSYKFHGWAASASVKGIYFYKNHYILTGLAPFVLLTPLLVTSIIIFPMHALGLYILLAIHTAGCMGDFFIVYKLIKYKNDALIHDYGDGMTFYTK